MQDEAVITGIGAISAIGHNPEQMMRSLRDGRGGIRQIEAFSTDGLSVHHAGELRDWRATDHFSPEDAAFMDRTAQLAVVAARQAVADAGMSASRLRSGRVALIYGICAGGIGAADGPGMLSLEGEPDGEALLRFRNTALYAQTDAVAADLGISGPCLTISTACAASTSAMSSALTLLRAGRVDAVVVGGADAWSRGTYAGFYSLGAMAHAPCSPFSRDTGVTFGEGAGCIVIERAEAARARGAPVHGLLLGCGTTSDAHHITSPNPGGQGLMRAMQLALADAGLEPGAIAYVNAHGTGTPDNDVAETVAVHRVFAGQAPPVSSSKSFFGHTLGAAGILEFIASLLGMNNEFLPPTLNFEAARPGCDLDYVANQARPCAFNAFMSLSAAFGGVNAVAVGARPGVTVARREPTQAGSIVISGVGVVSPIGHGIDAFRAALRQGTSGIAPITRFETQGLGCRSAGLIADLPARKLAPSADTRRMDAITRFAVVAATLALKDAGLAGRIAPERIGLHVAMSGGPVGSAQTFAEELNRNGIDKLSAKFFPPIVFATIGGQIGQSCQIRGASFIFMDGAGAGLQALAHAFDFLRQHEELDVLVVIAADEVAAMTYRMLDRLGLLAADGGMVPGEGAVAVVLERADEAAKRNAKPYGRIAGVALGAEGRNDDDVDPAGATLADVARRALNEAGGEAPDVVYGQASGDTRHDTREAAALRDVLNNAPVPISSLNGRLGLADAASGLFAVTGALLALRHGEVYPSHGVRTRPDGLDVAQDGMRTGDFRRALVLGSSQHGNSAAVLLTRD
jgi:3-oxoacyl-[acyl-carrier-protein] synthase II